MKSDENVSKARHPIANESYIVILVDVLRAQLPVLVGLQSEKHKNILTRPPDDTLQDAMLVYSMLVIYKTFHIITT